MKDGLMARGRGLFVHVVPLPHSDLPSSRRSPSCFRSMALLSTVLGFSVFGLASRFGQLAIQKRNLMDSVFFSSHPAINMSDAFLSDLAGHAIAMGAFGYAGYWVHRYEIRTNELIAWKRAEIQARVDAEREARAAAAA